MGDLRFMDVEEQDAVQQEISNPYRGKNCTVMRWNSSVYCQRETKLQVLWCVFKLYPDFSWILLFAYIKKLDLI